MNMTGKICVVTGATSGIGKGTVIGLATLGAKVLMISRTRDKGEATLSEVKRLVPGADVELMCADLSSQRSIKDLAFRIAGAHPHIDALVNCAGTFAYERGETTDGIESNLAVNYLSAFQLTAALRPLLERSQAGRIVTVSGELHRHAKLNFDDIQGVRSYSAFGSAAQGTLAKAVFTFELARRLKAEGSRITANCFHPGAVRSELTRHLPWYLRTLANMAGPFLRTIEQGAATAVFLVSSPAVSKVSGGYFIDEKAVEPSRFAKDPAVGERLWKLSEALVHIASETNEPSSKVASRLDIATVEGARS